MTKRTELLYVREFVYIMAGSKPVNATTVEQLGILARLPLHVTNIIVTIFSRLEDMLFCVWVWKYCFKLFCIFCYTGELNSFP